MAFIRFSGRHGVLKDKPMVFNLDNITAYFPHEEGGTVVLTNTGVQYFTQDDFDFVDCAIQNLDLARKR